MEFGQVWWKENGELLNKMHQVSVKQDKEDLNMVHNIYIVNNEVLSI